MSKIKIMMIVSSLNNCRCQYFPMDSPQELINEIAEVSSRMKTSLYKGLIETNKNKYTYQHYISEENNNNEEEGERKDNPVIFICSDLSYQDKKIEKIFIEMFEYLKKIGQKDSKISIETKKNLAQIFLRHQNVTDNNKDTEFGVIEEYTGCDMTSGTSSSFFEITQTISLNDSKKKKKLKDIEKKRRDEIENIKRWKKVKMLYLVISIVLLFITLISIPFVRKGNNDHNPEIINES